MFENNLFKFENLELEELSYIENLLLGRKYHLTYTGYFYNENSCNSKSEISFINLIIDKIDYKNINILFNLEELLYIKSLLFNKLEYYNNFIDLNEDVTFNCQIDFITDIINKLPNHN